MNWTDQFRRLTSDIPKVGVLHVGAHDGREVSCYQEFPRVVLVEPNPVRAGQLRRIPNVEVVEAAVTNQAGPVILHVTDRDVGSSLLEPLVDYSPVGAVWVDTVTLDDVDGVNVLVVDVQGSEVDVLTSGDLTRFDLIVCETSTHVRYEGGCTEQDVLDALGGWRVVARFDQPTNPGVADLVFQP